MCVFDFEKFQGGKRSARSLCRAQGPPNFERKRLRVSVWLSRVLFPESNTSLESLFSWRGAESQSEPLSRRFSGACSTAHLSMSQRVAILEPTRPTYDLVPRGDDGLSTHLEQDLWRDDGLHAEQSRFHKSSDRSQAMSAFVSRKQTTTVSTKVH